MGRDGLAPSVLSALHPRYRTPVLAGLALTGWSILLVVGVALLVRYPIPVIEIASDFSAVEIHLDLNLPPGADAFDVLTDYAIFGSVSFETLAIATLFAFRRRYPRGQVELPYRCPLFPWLPLTYVLIMAAVLFNMFRTKQVQSLVAVGFIAVGAVVYLLVFARRPAKTLDPPG
jgi:amino acid transporter